MNEVASTSQIYPNGIEHRTPRPRQALLGALIGGLLGFAVTQNPAGAIAGGTLGGALANQPVELPQALRQNFAEKKLEFVRFYRLGRFGAKIIFKYNETFVALESHAPQTPVMTQEQIDDWLYGDLTEQRFSNFKQRFARKFER